MQKVRHVLTWAVIASECSHVFCCVLPTAFSALSLLAGLGFAGLLPGWLVGLHEALHRWEAPIVALSGGILALGWALDRWSRRIDCHDTGCGHGPCGPQKTVSNKVLKIATILFVVNVLVWGIFHRGLGIFMPH